MKKFNEKITPHLRGLINNGSDAICGQFVYSKTKNGGRTVFPSVDPLGENKFAVAKGLVHKYKNRALWKVSYECAAHCQFCTRRRQVGNKEDRLTKKDIEDGLKYISVHNEIEEVIISGGDPLFNPETTKYILERLVKIKSVKSIRIGTRLPIHFPQAFDSQDVKEIVSFLGKYSKILPIYVLIHINHPDELTKESVRVFKDLRRKGLILMSQTVFLKNINDEIEVLHDLFRKVYFLGIIPYYIFRCDYVKGLEAFVCDIKKEQKIMTELTRRLSGIAVPTHVFDVPGKGKIPVPLDFWDGIDLSRCKDFENKEVLI